MNLTTKYEIAKMTEWKGKNYFGSFKKLYDICVEEKKND